jgi:hypothetical protein
LHLPQAESQWELVDFVSYTWQQILQLPLVVKVEGEEVPCRLQVLLRAVSETSIQHPQ